MNREDIIRMAQEAGIDIDAWEPLYEGDSAGFRVCECTHEELERFADLVASAAQAKEREACARVCDVIAQKMDDEGEGPTGNIGWVIDCADSIRARGQA